MQSQANLLSKRCHSTPCRFAPFSNANQCSNSRRHCRVALKVSLSATTGKLEDVPLFGSSTSSLLGSSNSSSSNGTASSAAKLDEVSLKSDAGVDYTALREALRKADLRDADDETRRLLIQLAGPDAVKRGWVYFTEVKTISVNDLQTIDNLWRAASNNRFGYRVQKELWVQTGRRWPKFFKNINWVQGENNNYRKWPGEFIYSNEAPKGHLPLTNALRGTQLFQNILEHPAFDPAVGKQSLDQAAAESAKKSSRSIMGL